MSLEIIRNRMRERDIDCVIITEEPNFRYAIGESASGYMFVTRDDVDIVVSNFYRHDLEGFSPDYARSRKDYDDLLEKRQSLYGGRIVTDSGSERLKECFGAERTGFMGDVRKVKTSEEIDRIRRACEITGHAFEKLRPQLFSGMTEWDAYSVLSQHYSDNGVQDAFLTNKGQSLVQRNSLSPHRLPEREKIQSGDMVIVDTGARYRHYCADVTRTYCDSPSEEQRELFRAVKEIQTELVDMIEPGLPVSRIQEREQDLVKEKGYDPDRHTLHLPGHSLGIEAHEKPSIRRESDEEFREGMVVAIEPALYVPELGGCRIEDTVLVTSGGSERLSRVPREL